MNFSLHKDILIRDCRTISEAITQLSKSNHKCLLVVKKNNELIGSITNGDIRRFLAKSKKFYIKVKNVCNKNFIFLENKKFKKKELKKKFFKKKVTLLPVIDNKKKIINCYYLKDFVSKKVFEENLNNQNIEAVIMAGGFGKRLAPFSDILPKPLLPIEGKTAIDNIIQLILKYKIKRINLTLSYKKNIIKSYLKDNYKNKKLFSFINENKPMGTVGSLVKLKKFTKKDILLFNCDTILNINLNDFIDFHYCEKFDLTLISAIKNIQIPYGVFQIKKNSMLRSIIEKPKKRYLVNVGGYMINNSILNLIPSDKIYNMDQLIADCLKKGYRIGIYPIDEKDWLDTGDWNEISNFLNKDR